MGTRRIWTNEEEQVLIDLVRNHSNNLSRAFSEASDRLNRSKHAIEQHWYIKTRHRGPVFMTIGSRTTVNSKNGNTQGKRVSLTIWQRIKRLLNI